MTQELAESVKDLAKPTVEALGVITERECPECCPDLPHYQCKICSGTGKMAWKWKPKVREWFYWVHYREIKPELVQDSEMCSTLSASMEHGTSAIPILPWEEIERVLEGVGYYLQMNKPLDVYIKKGEMKVGCSIYQIGRDDFIRFAQAKSRQEAVMKAVIKLGENLKEIAK